MYSVVLMAALSGSAAAPDWGCHRCHGCHACAGWFGHGGGLGCACWAHTGVGGCWCAGYFGGYPPIGHDFCSYCGCFACYGYPTGLGAGYGNGGFAGRGGWNGGWNGGGLCNCGACGGCWCNGCACGCCSCGVSGGSGLSGWAAPTPAAEQDSKKDKKPQEEVRLQSRGRLIVQVPEDAKVYIDGKLMKSTSSPRVFGTPELRRDQVYFYDITAEVVRDGQKVSDTKRVYLRVGEVARASFGDMAPVTATVGSDE